MFRLGFDFESLRGDPQRWADTYHVVMSNIFNPLSSLFIKFSFIWKRISTKFVQTQEATDRLLSMMENLADEKRRQILNGEMKNLADSEKDLLTMMIEADIEEGTKTTTTQLRVRHTCDAMHAAMLIFHLLLVYSKI